MNECKQKIKEMISLLDENVCEIVLRKNGELWYRHTDYGYFHMSDLTIDEQKSFIGFLKYGISAA